MAVRRSTSGARRAARFAQVTLGAVLLLWSSDALANQSIINAITQACAGQQLTVNVNDCATCHGSSFTTINPSNMYFSDAQSGFYDSFCPPVDTGSTTGTGTDTGTGTGTSAGGTDTGTGTDTGSGTTAGSGSGSGTDDGTMAGDDTSDDMSGDDGPRIGGLGDDGTDDGGYRGHRGSHSSGGGDTSTGDDSGSTDVASGSADSAPRGNAWGRSDGWSDGRRHTR
jgi:hypothetical protein